MKKNEKTVISEKYFNFQAAKKSRKTIYAKAEN